MRPILVTLQQGTPEWHSWRLSGIGGSDAPVIENCSPYKTLRQLFLEKKGKDAAVEEDDSKEFIFAKGHRTEELIRQQFRDLVKVDIQPVCFQHAEHGHMLASLDGFDLGLGVLEGKLVSKAVLKDVLENGNIPEHHNVQMQHQMIVSGADVGRWFGHDGSKQGALVEVPADKEMQKRLIEKELAFWEDVKSNRVPALSDRDYLVPDDQALLLELRDAKELAENAQMNFEALRQKAIEQYGHVKISGGGLKLFRVTRTGSLNPMDIPEVKDAAETVMGDLPSDYIENFRKKGSESWTVKIDTVRKAKS